MINHHRCPNHNFLRDICGKSSNHIHYRHLPMAWYRKRHQEMHRTFDSNH
nr:MAG TPA: hypothetical protein [Caudoviricetes sp.]